ncbi:MAG TPA: hypothetical protein ENF51_01325 [Candidatus Aenigmarchaeota archaeon]|nr:hypothetical protein [Candidatus Aenigmarchaeota archaeon]
MIEELFRRANLLLISSAFLFSLLLLMELERNSEWEERAEFLGLVEVLETLGSLHNPCEVLFEMGSEGKLYLSEHEIVLVGERNMSSPLEVELVPAVLDTGKLKLSWDGERVWMSSYT